MWQRFDEEARRSVYYAQEEGQKYGEGNCSTEHLLLGLLRDEGCMACLVLAAIGASLAVIRAKVIDSLPPAQDRPAVEATIAPRAKRAINLAYVEAQDLNVSFIGTEHLLLGLLRERDGLAGRVLATLGVDLAKARREVWKRQVAGPAQPAEPNQQQTAGIAYSWASYGQEAQRAILQADASSRSTGKGSVSTDELALALLADPDSAASKALIRAGLDLVRVREEIERKRPWAEGSPPIVMSDKTHQAIESTYREANLLQSETIGSDHLLLGLANSDREGIGNALMRLGVSPFLLRRIIEGKEPG